MFKFTKRSHFSEKKKIKIDPKEFALAAVSGAQFDGLDDVQVTKRSLQKYLSTYLLLEDFNNLEAKHFKLFNQADRKLLAKALQNIMLR